jgi:hypothetical protein
MYFRLAVFFVYLLTGLGPVVPVLAFGPAGHLPQLMRADANTLLAIGDVLDIHGILLLVTLQRDR